MKCTKCSTVVKPIVAIDIDGTLGDYHGHFLQFMSEYLWTGGIFGQVAQLYSYRGDVPFKEWCMKRFDIDERTWHDIKLAYRQGAQKRTMPAFVGAAELTWAVRNVGAELWMTTTRPYLRLDNIDPDTRAWLARHAIEYDHMLYDEDKYVRLAELVDIERVVAIVDDLPSLVVEAEQVFGPEVPILKVGPYNRVAAPMGMARLRDIQDEIVSRIEQWKEQYA